MYSGWNVKTYIYVQKAGKKTINRLSREQVSKNSVGQIAETIASLQKE